MRTADHPLSDPDSPGYRVRLPGTWQSLHPLRRGLGEWLGAILPESGPRFDLVLVGSELFATAVRADRSDTSTAFAVAAWVEGHSVVIEVRQSHESIDRAGRGIESDEASRALAVVAAIVEVLQVQARGGLLLRAKTQVAPSDRRFQAGTAG